MHFEQITIKIILNQKHNQFTNKVILLEDKNSYSIFYLRAIFRLAGFHKNESLKGRFKRNQEL